MKTQLELIETSKKIIPFPVINKPKLKLVVKKPKSHYIKVPNTIVNGILFETEEIDKNKFTVIDIPIILYWNRLEDDVSPSLFNISTLIGYPPSFINRILKNSKSKIVTLQGENLIVDSSWLDNSKGNKLIDFSVFKFMKSILQEKKIRFLVYYQFLYLYFFNQFSGKTSDKRNFDLTKVIHHIGLTELYTNPKHGYRAKEYIEIGFQLLVEIGMIKKYSISYKSKQVDVEKEEKFFEKIKPVKETKKWSKKKKKSPSYQG